MIAMSLCKNGTNPNITCKSKEEIVEMVKGKTLPFFLDVESERIDHYNVNNPIQKDFFEIQMYLNIKRTIMGFMLSHHHLSNREK